MWKAQALRFYPKGTTLPIIAIPTSDFSLSIHLCSTIEFLATNGWRLFSPCIHLSFFLQRWGPADKAVFMPLSSTRAKHGFE